MTCPHPPGTEAHWYWWENYFILHAIPKAIRECEEQKQYRQTLKDVRHFHEFDPYHRKCIHCGIWDLQYEKNPTLCPSVEQV